MKDIFFQTFRRILFFWVRTKVADDAIQSLGLDPEKPICYVLERRSLSDLAVLEQECIKVDVQRPYAGLDRDGLSEKHAFFFLHEPEKMLRFSTQKSNKRYSDRLVNLLELVQSTEHLDVKLVPVSIFWGQAPQKENSILKALLSDNWRVTGRLRKFFVILFQGRNVFVEFNKAISLKQLLDDGLELEHTARKLSRVLRVHFRRTRTAVLGPDLSHRRTLMNELLQADLVQAAIEEHAQQEAVTIQDAEKKARRYANEIASDISHGVVRFFDILLTWLWNRLYAGIEVNYIDRVKAVAKEYEIVYVPCHRSHMDYLLMGYVLYYNGLSLPHIAAGKNLNMPIVGSLLRRGGAFFMRRSFSDDALYKVVFNEYLHLVFSKGHSIEYYIEGGRSRTGRLLNPRTGMLMMTLQSFLRDPKRPIAFVPVHLGYEKVFEGRTYLNELKGKTKKKESITGIFQAMRRLKISLGKVRVNFAEPILLDQFLQQHQADWPALRQDMVANPAENQHPEWVAALSKQLAIEIVKRINQSAAMTPISLVALVLLSMPKQSMDERALIHRLDELVGLFRAIPYHSDVTLPEGNGREWLDYVETKMKVVVRQEHELGDIICLEGTNAVLMTYYRNTILHLFALPALLACFFLQNRSVSRQKIVATSASIYPYLQAELFLPWTIEEATALFEQWLDCFVEKNLLCYEDGKLRRAPTNSVEFSLILVLGQTVIQTLERYYITLSLIQNSDNGKIKAEDLENQCHMMAQRMSMLHGFNAPEFFDKSLFKNFILMLKKTQVLQENSQGYLVYADELAEMVKSAKLILRSEVRQSIKQVTSLR